MRKNQNPKSGKQLLTAGFEAVFAFLLGGESGSSSINTRIERFQFVRFKLGLNSERYNRERAHRRRGGR